MAKKQYIDITPTWQGIVNELLPMYCNMDEEGKRGFHTEMLRLAKFADAHNKKNKKK